MWKEESEDESLCEWDQRIVSAYVCETERERERVKLNSKWVCVSLSVVVWWDKVQWRVCRCEEHRWRHISVPLGARMSWAILENERERERGVCVREGRRERDFIKRLWENPDIVCVRERDIECVWYEKDKRDWGEREGQVTAHWKRKRILFWENTSVERVEGFNNNNNLDVCC